MKKVKIYLRTILVNNETQLMLFDSNRNGAVNDLVTEAPAGSTLIWKTDNCSGIEKILRVYSKTGKGNVFHTEPKKCRFSKGFYLNLSTNAKGEEAYSIEYIPCGKEKVTIDPTIKIPPPPLHG